MKVTEELLQKADQIQNFSDGIIMPDGDYRLIEENGHLQRTGCVLTDYNSTVGMAMTPEQKEVFDALVKHGIISPEYFDITKQRQKMREQAK